MRSNMSFKTFRQSSVLGRLTLRLFSLLLINNKIGSPNTQIGEIKETVNNSIVTLSGIRDSALFSGLQQGVRRTKWISNNTIEGQAIGFVIPFVLARLSYRNSIRFICQTMMVVAALASNDEVITSVLLPLLRGCRIPPQRKFPSSLRGLNMVVDVRLARIPRSTITLLSQTELTWSLLI